MSQGLVHKWVKQHEIDKRIGALSAVMPELLNLKSVKPASGDRGKAGQGEGYCRSAEEWQGLA